MKMDLKSPMHSQGGGEISYWSTSHLQNGVSPSRLQASWQSQDFRHSESQEGGCIFHLQGHNVPKGGSQGKKDSFGPASQNSLMMGFGHALSTRAAGLSQSHEVRWFLG